MTAARTDINALERFVEQVYGTEPLAIAALRTHHARDVGRTEGQWQNGWRDFDPRNPLATV